MKIYGTLIRAALETIADPAAAIVGRFWWNSTDGQVKVDDGTNVRALLRNDAKARIGNSGTASQNVRFHRGAAGVLQFVAGDDATAEGSLSTSLNQISARLENYTFAGKPAAANAGRVVWITDRSSAMVDTGAAWVPVGSGGGGGSLQWVEDQNSPTALVVNADKVYAFQNALAQSLYALIRVPAGYVAGSQINLRVPFISPDSSGTVLVNTVTTLVRTGTDLITSTTNQRTSTNSAVTMTGGKADIPQAVVCDLTDSSGQVNGVAVSAGDLLRVQLTRDATDTATSDVNVPVYGAEVTFS